MKSTKKSEEMRHAAWLALLLLAQLAAGDDDDAQPVGKPATEGFLHALGESFFVILATEVGDRTFFIAAIMAMRQSRLIVWSGAAGALVVMTVLSTLVGSSSPPGRRLPCPRHHRGCP